jgi:hypothetical protein
MNEHSFDCPRELVPPVSLYRHPLALRRLYIFLIDVHPPLERECHGVRCQRLGIGWVRWGECGGQ